MKETNSILEDIREAVGLGRETPDFDTDLLMHINSAISKLRQNGVTLATNVNDETTTWSDLKNPLMVANNDHFQAVPLFVMLSTKIVFDPPPPSTVEYYSKRIDEELWRLKIAYEDFSTTSTTTEH